MRAASLLLRLVRSVHGCVDDAEDCKQKCVVVLAQETATSWRYTMQRTKVHICYCSTTAPSITLTPILPAVL